VTYFSKVEMLTLGETIVTEIRSFVFAHLQRLSLSFHESMRSGELVYRLTSDINDLKPALIDLPQNFIYRLAVIFSHVGLMLVLEWRLALLAFSVLPLLYAAHRRIGVGVHSATTKKKTKESEISALVAENVTAMALVQAYGLEGTQQARFALENRASLASGVEAMRLSKIFRRINGMLVACGTAGGVYWGGTLALEQAISPGTVVLFVAYLRKLYGPLDKLADLMLSVAKSQVAGERLLQLLECDMFMQDGPKAVPAPSFRGHVAYRKVSFGYSDGQAVLKDIDFVVKPGETVAILGHNGAGKSTLISLLLRFYDPQMGRILIDGRDLREFTLQSLRDQITVVMQEARLFNKSVRENIGFGKMGATDREIMQAAKLAQAHDFIVRMPDGYDTIIYEGGENLSGGQKQRLNLARAIIRNTPIVILDEPATAVDAETEAKIHEALQALTREKTTFIIAHKFSTVAHADRVLLLRKGRIAAYGTHEELRHTSPVYRAMYAWQFGRRSDDITIEPAEAMIEA
jgi:ATP-binding cassette subfamily B protein